MVPSTQRIDQLLGQLFSSGLGLPPEETAFVERKLGVLLADIYMNGGLTKADRVRAFLRRNAAGGLPEEACVPLLERFGAAAACMTRSKAAASRIPGDSSIPCGAEQIGSDELGRVFASEGEGVFAGIVCEGTPAGDTLASVLAGLEAEAVRCAADAEAALAERGEANASLIIVPAARTLAGILKKVRTLFCSAESLVVLGLNEVLFGSGLAAHLFAADTLRTNGSQLLQIPADAAGFKLDHGEQAVLVRLTALAAFPDLDDLKTDGLPGLASLTPVPDADPDKAFAVRLGRLADDPDIPARLRGFFRFCRAADQLLAETAGVFSRIADIRRKTAEPRIALLAPPHRALIRSAIRSAEEFKPVTVTVCLTALLRQHAYSRARGLDPSADILCALPGTGGSVPDYAIPI